MTSEEPTDLDPVVPEDAAVQPEPSLVALRWGYNMDKRPNSHPLPDPSLRAQAAVSLAAVVVLAIFVFAIAYALVAIVDARRY